jgi:hypothetical protein
VEVQVIDAEVSVYGCAGRSVSISMFRSASTLQPRRVHLNLLVVSALVAAAPARLARAQEAPPLVLEAAVVRPTTAAADTLCHMEARIHNGGKEIASAFAFRLKLDDHDVGAYRDHLFLDPIEPGTTRVLPLLSFWTNETGRPLPASGTLRVELTLESARWMKQEKDAEGVRVWTDLGAVGGLPQTARASVAIEK